MKKENNVVKMNASEHLAPSGRGWHVVPGEGVLNKEHFMGTPSSPFQGTSPARGEVNGGFTLIELLVVVLIIGILAAVAVPQYQKAVYKSRYATLKSLVRSIANAQEVYYLANGKYASTFKELDIDVPTPVSTNEDNGNRTYDEYTYDWGMCRLIPAERYASIKCRNTFINMDHQIYQTNSAVPNKTLCVILTDDATSYQAKICKQETGKTTHSEYGTGWKAYQY